MIFQAARTTACSNSAGVLNWHCASWKQFTTASASVVLLVPLVLYLLQHTGTQYSQCYWTLRSHLYAKYRAIQLPIYVWMPSGFCKKDR